MALKAKQGVIDLVTEYEPLSPETEAKYNAVRERLYRNFPEVANDVEMLVNAIIDEAWERGFNVGWEACTNPTKLLFDEVSRP